MRLRILHETAYRYATPAGRVVENLRLTPRGHDGQFVANWRIDVDRDCRLDVTTDPFGNTCIPSPSKDRSTASRSPPAARSRRRTRRASSTARSNRCRRHVPARHGADRRRRRDPRLCRDDRRGGRARQIRSLHALDARHPRSGSASRWTRPIPAPARPRRSPSATASARTSPTSSSPPPAISTSGPLRQRLSLPPGASGTGGRPRLGRGVRARPRLGRLRPGERHLPDRYLCPRSRSASTISAPPRSAARATAAAAKAWPSGSRSPRPGAAAAENAPHFSVATRPGLL